MFLFFILRNYSYFLLLGDFFPSPNAGDVHDASPVEWLYQYIA